MLIPDRNGAVSGTDYRYGFNGMEKVGEVTNSESHYDFGARIYDSRLGRWLSVDPFAKKFPSWSSYSFVMNCPIVLVDKDGRDIYHFDENGKLLSIVKQDGPHVFFQITSVTEFYHDESLTLSVGKVEQVDGSRFIPQLYVYHRANSTLHEFVNGMFTNGQKELAQGVSEYAGVQIVAEAHHAFNTKGGIFFWGLISTPLILFVGEAIPAFIYTAIVEEIIDNAIIEVTGVDLPISFSDIAEGIGKKALKENIGKAKNKLQPDINAAGSHSTFELDDNGHIYKYETYEKTSKGFFDPRIRFDGGKPNGDLGAPHQNMDTPHMTGKDVLEGVRKPKDNETPNNPRFK